MADSPVAAYQVKQSNGQFKLVGSPYATAPYGIAIPKSSGLDKAVLAALKVLIENGTYDDDPREVGRPGRSRSRRRRSRSTARRASRRAMTLRAPRWSTSELTERRGRDGPRRSRPSRSATRGAGSRRRSCC